MKKFGSQIILSKGQTYFRHVGRMVNKHISFINDVTAASKTLHACTCSIMLCALGVILVAKCGEIELEADEMIFVTLQRLVQRVPNIKNNKQLLELSRSR